jgi:predicted chitinase
MLISPPFLPRRLVNQAEEEWIDSAMRAGQPGDGAYPVSFNLGWHGGTHLTAPSLNNGTERVRSIADGAIVFVRSPAARQDDMNHPQNYHGGWTDNGCVVIRHETDIGTGSGATNVQYFSVYMHLSEIAPTVRVGRRVYRKDVLGQAGQIYGSTQRKIHFEIVCDDENLRKLVGRTKGDLNIERDGRVDCIYGSVYFRLAARTQIFGAKPLANMVEAHQQPPKPTRNAPLPPVEPIPVAYSTQTALIVEIRYDCGEAGVPGRGDALVSTLGEDGVLIGSALTEPGADYDLYPLATSIRNSLSGEAAPPISALYEQLRFGRVVNQAHERAVGVNVPHWRRISYPGGTGWVNLNAHGVQKFSDADLPHWCGWTIVDDSTDRDSRCDSEIVKALIAKAGDSKGSSPRERDLNAAFTNPIVRARLAKTICKIPSEWNTSTIDARWSWLKQKTNDQTTPLSDEDFAALRKHIEAMGFELPALDTALWHWDPVTFMKHFRKCCWLSHEELASLLPRRSGPSSGQLSTIPWATALERMEPYVADLNMAMRKYGISTRLRQAHLLAQTYIETALWRTMEEIGRGHQSRRRDGTLFWPAPAMEFYQAFYGRGIMQLTWAGNYESYGTYRAFPDGLPTHAYSDSRITNTSTHYWADPRNQNHQVTGQGRRWAPRFDPDIIASDSFNACDSGAHYWVSKDTGQGHRNINRVADQGLTTERIGRVSVLVNGGSYGYAERQAYAAFIKRYLLDNTDTTETETFSVSHRGNNFNVYVDFTPQRRR